MIINDIHSIAAHALHPRFRGEHAEAMESAMMMRDEDEEEEEDILANLYPELFPDERKPQPLQEIV